MSDDKLERAIHEIQNEAINPSIVEDAARRVWAKLREAAPEDGPIVGCAGFEALFAGYRAGRLSESRTLLVKDHLKECVACRKAYAGGGGSVVPMPAPRARAARLVYSRWAIAAALLLAAGLAAYTVWNQTGSGRGRVTVQSAGGALFRLDGQVLQTVPVGMELAPGTEIRTAKNSTAMLRLGDGSEVEMSERSAVSVGATRSDINLRLGAGSIIVQAAKRRSGRLYVIARDCRVAVTGTVFSVNSGLKGSRVSVIEGEVRVSQPGGETVLRPGDQLTTSASVAAVPVRQEIAWSRNAEQHRALLREFSAIQRRIAEIPMPGVRYASTLLDLLPANTAIYAAVPNLGSFLDEAHRIFWQRVQESAVLREWWEQKMERGQGPKLDEVIARIREASGFLGDEIVLAAILTPAGKIGHPILLAEVKKPGLREFLERELHVPSNLTLLIQPGLAAFSPDAESLDAIAARTGGFAGTPFHQRIASAYQAGVGMLFSADLETIAKSSGPGRHPRGPGLPNVKYLVVEQKEAGGRTETRAGLSFDGARSGIAAWLSEPAPIGALEFVSPDASVAAAAVMKSPGAVLDDVFSWMEKANPDFRQQLAGAETMLGLKVRDDLAAPLGGEFAIALDGPPLPPSWKLAVEVYDASRFQWTLEKLVEAANREGARHNLKPVTLSQETVGSRVFHTVTLPQGKLVPRICYTFEGGYVLAAPSRGLLESAIASRASGNTLTRSAGFASLLPRDHHANFSAVAYHNLAPAAGALGEMLGARQDATLQQWATEWKPTLIAVYGEEDRITLATTGSIFNLTANRMDLAGMFGLNKRGTRGQKPSYP